MSAVEILLGAVEPIGIRLRQGATLTTGATVRTRVLRASDGFELDWSTNTFVTAGTAVTPRQALTETPATSGLYEYAWNTATITNPVTPDTYLAEFDQTAPTARAFLRQSEIRVRSAQSISAAVALVQADTDNIQTRLPAALVGGRIDASVGAMQSDTITATAIAIDAIDADALATSAVTEIADGVWSTAVPGAFLGGSAGFILGTNLNATVASRAQPGDAMALINDAITAAKIAVGAIEADAFAADAISTAAFSQGAADKVWLSATRTLTAGAITSATFAADAIDAAALATSAVNEIVAAVWVAATRTLTSVVLDDSSLTAGKIGAGFVTAVQAGLATLVQVATVPGLVWDELLASHVTAGSAGLTLSTLGSGSTPAGIAAAVWATAEGSPTVGTMGYAQVLGRQFMTNKLYESAGNPGQIVLFADNGSTPLLTWELRDLTGGAVYPVPGEPARREAST